MRLRLATAHLGATGVNLRVYLLDTASGITTGPLDSPMAFFETKTVNGALCDEYNIAYTTPSAPTIVYYKFVITNGSGVAFYSDDYIDDYDNVNKDGAGAANAHRTSGSVPDYRVRPQFPDARPGWPTRTSIIFSRTASVMATLRTTTA